MNEYISLAIFIFVYILIVGRIKFRIPIWASMLIGAALMIGFQIISPASAFKSVQIDVIMFLFGMFSIVSALDKAGVLRYIAIKMLSRAKTPDRILLIFVVGIGSLSAFLVNDTIALMGVPLVAYISKHIGVRPAVLLIALAFGVTVGSVMTPIGNPQNLLIALQSGIDLPFTNFIKFLAVPTIINLFLTYYILKIYFKKDMAQVNLQNIALENAVIVNKNLAKISIGVLIATIAGFFISEVLKFLKIADLNLSLIALSGAAVLYVLSRDRKEIIQNVDYSVLVFFAAMFIVTAAVWSSGAIPMLIKTIPVPTPDNPLQSNAIISIASISLGQVLSNVPFVSLYHYVMIQNGFTGDNVSSWMMLAAASTVAGNLTILAAASNIIIIQASESRGIKAFTFFEFFKIGALVTVVNLLVYYLFILLI
ncbi:MAG TPA: SLC13 family permease [Candidatus Nitrosotalea sp.]|nr:SLC13 family permease [Candidatus Nitrosotalea sp.]